MNNIKALHPMVAELLKLPCIEMRDGDPNVTVVYQHRYKISYEHYFCRDPQNALFSMEFATEMLWDDTRRAVEEKHALLKSIGKKYGFEGLRG